MWVRDDLPTDLMTWGIDSYLEPAESTETVTVPWTKWGVPHQLQVIPDTDRMIREHDVETAISSLPPDEQRMARLYMKTDSPCRELLSTRHLAELLGMPHGSIPRKWIPIRNKLAVLLADYAPEKRAERTSHGKVA
jgi:hypothetical protein